MKIVKTLLIFISLTAVIFASETRVNALGGAGFWADDYANITTFPASVNNHNVAWTDGSDFTSVWNNEGTTWGFAGGSGDDMANVWWGNGTYGVNFGFGMAPAVEAEPAVNCEDETNTCDEYKAGSDAVDAKSSLNIGFGMPLAGMDFGFTYGMGCDDCGGGAVGVNIRRAQQVWLFENILVDFEMGMEGDNATEDPATMGLGVDLYKNTTYDSGINSLFGLGFNYDSEGDNDPAMGIVWNFAVESAMTDWATLRIGYSHNYDFASGNADVIAADAVTPVSCEDETTTCDEYMAGSDAVEQVGGLVVGLGFNYGSFNLDMNVSSYEKLFTNPGQYITGRNETLGGNWTISYNW